MASPMPRLEPVTSAVWSFSFICLLLKKCPYAGSFGFGNILRDCGFYGTGFNEVLGLEI
jgi:hypothetical protein